MAGQARAGFYPAAPEAVKAMLLHLKLPDPPSEKSLFKNTDLCMLDPCAGEGEALQILSEGLDIKQENVFAVELHKDRSDKIRERMPNANVLGPCSFFGAEISAARFSLIYVNPPFDYSSDNNGYGTREEFEFVRRAYDLLTPKGIVILVCPKNVFIGRDFASAFDSMFEHAEVYKFPDGHRPFNEVAVFGRKRSTQLDAWNVSSKGDLCVRGLGRYEARELDVSMLPALGEPQVSTWKKESAFWSSPMRWVPGERRDTIDEWVLPYSWPPRKFAKSKLTEEEKADEVRRSPLWDLLRSPEPEPLPRPWMQPQKGHTIMLMVSGLLDGLVPADPPHVARGTYLKKERIDHSKCKTIENEETGAVTTVTHYSEEPVSIVRCIEVDSFGEPRIHEFRSDAQESDDDDYGDGGADDDEEDY